MSLLVGATFWFLTEPTPFNIPKWFSELEGDINSIGPIASGFLGKDLVPIAWFLHGPGC